MSFKSRFADPESLMFEGPDCIYGPPWCGLCDPAMCLYLMQYAFRPETQQAIINVEGDPEKIYALENLILERFGSSLTIEVDYQKEAGE